jgi:hypothetical protein
VKHFALALLTGILCGGTFARAGGLADTYVYYCTETTMCLGEDACEGVFYSVQGCTLQCWSMGPGGGEIVLGSSVECSDHEI